VDGNPNHGVAPATAPRTRFPVLRSRDECRQVRGKAQGLEQALTLWTGPALEEFQGEEWASAETARLTEIHAASVDNYVDYSFRPTAPPMPSLWPKAR
jgi:Bacterial transcriptional activator domain